MHKRVPSVRLRDVVKRYRNGSNCVWALRNVSLEVYPRECLAVLGPSGSGKSTLVNVIGGVEAADEGSVEVAGQDLSGRSEDELALFRRRSIGVVHQSFNLIASLTVEENVALPLLLDGWSKRRARERVLEMVSRVGLESRVRHRPGELSGGEMQRVAVARALIGNPELVLADEPTGSLDSKQGQAVLDLLRGLTSTRGRTMIVVTHDARATEWSDRVVELHDGCVRSVGGCQERESAMATGS